MEPLLGWREHQVNLEEKKAKGRENSHTKMTQCDYIIKILRQAFFKLPKDKIKGMKNSWSIFLA